LDLRQFTTWCWQHDRRLFDVRRVDIECFARHLEDAGRARATVARRLCTIVGFYRYSALARGRGQLWTWLVAGRSTVVRLWCEHHPFEGVCHPARTCLGELDRMMTTTPRSRLCRTATALVLTLSTAAACGGDSRKTSSVAPTSATTPTTRPTSAVPTTPTTSSNSTSASSGESRISVPVEPGSTVEGLVSVDGHDIYARCAGIGSPTIVYFTGYAPDRSKRGVAIAPGIENALGPGFRMCSYERRNTGRSETVDGTQSPEDLIADVDGVLAALDEHGPFLLLGASFGGLVASAYAVAHPDKVAGVVLLDASTGVDYDIEEQHDFKEACLEANRHADAFDSLEMIDNCTPARWVHDRRDQEPDVPLLYLAAQDPSDRGSVADDATRQAWAASWSPGTWRVVSAPHWMDEADTQLVANAVREVLDPGT
jgi:pimeloyl-ACP methyl ester carboxylesterase